MVGAMFAQSPGYFKEFQKQFNFLITSEKKLSSVKYFAVLSHFDSTFCQLTMTTKSTNHFSSDRDIRSSNNLR